MPQAFGGYHLLLVITCDQTNFTIAVPLRDWQTQMIAEVLIYRVIYLFSPARRIVCDEAAEFTSAIIQAILTMLNCKLKLISPYNHGSSKCKRQMNSFTSEALSGFSPFQLIFLWDPPDLTSTAFPKIDTIPVNYHEYYSLLLARAQMIGILLLEWRTKQALEYEKKNRQYTNEEMFLDDQ